MGPEELDFGHQLHRGVLPALQQQYFPGDSDCKVHRGFYYAFTDIQKQILDTVASYRTKYPHNNL